MAERTIIQELVSVFKFETDEAGLRGFLQTTAHAAQTVRGLVDGAKIAIGAVKGLADVVVGSTLAWAEEADATIKAADALGIYVGRYDALKSAFGFGGVSEAAVTPALSTLTRQLAEFAKTGKGAGADILKASGFTQESAGQVKDITKALGQVGDGLARIEDPAKRSAEAQKLFGEAGLKLIPLLKGGAVGFEEIIARATRWGVTTERLGRESEALDDNLLDLRLAMRGVGLQMAEYTVPWVRRFTDSLVENAAALRSAGDEAGATAGSFDRLFAVLKVGGIFTGSVIGITLLPKLAAIVATSSAGVVAGLAWARTLIAFGGGGVVGAIRALAAAFGLLRASAAGAWVATFAPVAIGAAAITGLILVLEDVVAFFEGKNSLLGEFLDWLDGVGAGLDDAVASGDAFGATMAAIAGVISEGLRTTFTGELFPAIGLSAELLWDDIANGFVGLLDRLAGAVKATPILGRLLGGDGAGAGAAAPPPSNRSTTVQVGGSTTSIVVQGAGDPRAVGSEVVRRQGQVSDATATRVLDQLRPAMSY